MLSVERVITGDATEAGWTTQNALRKSASCLLQWYGKVIIYHEFIMPLTYLHFLELNLPENFIAKCNSRQKEREVKLVIDLWARSPSPSPERKPKKKKPKQTKPKTKTQEKKKSSTQGEQICLFSCSCRPESQTSHIQSQHSVSFSFWSTHAINVSTFRTGRCRPSQFWWWFGQRVGCGGYGCEEKRKATPKRSWQQKKEKAEQEETAKEEKEVPEKEEKGIFAVPSSSDTTRAPVITSRTVPLLYIVNKNICICII